MLVLWNWIWVLDIKKGLKLPKSSKLKPILHEKRLKFAYRKSGLNQIRV